MKVTLGESTTMRSSFLLEVKLTGSTLEIEVLEIFSSKTHEAIAWSQLKNLTMFK